MMISQFLGLQNAKKNRILTHFLIDLVRARSSPEKKRKPKRWTRDREPSRTPKIKLSRSLLHRKKRKACKLSLKNVLKSSLSVDIQVKDTLSTIISQKNKTKTKTKQNKKTNKNKTKCYDIGGQVQQIKTPAIHIYMFQRSIGQTDE